MNKSIQAICVRPEEKIPTVLSILQNHSFGICLVTDEQGHILGTITDGDCRRAFLNGVTIDGTASQVMHKNFVVVDTSFSFEQVKTLMRRNSLRQIPIVDQDNHLVDLVTTVSNKVLTPERPESAFILAGGKGIRLRPLTELLPKPMLPVGGRPMLERLIEQLVRHGMKKIYLSINYLGHTIEEYFKDGSKFGCEIEYVREALELGTAGPLKLVQDKIKEPILVLNSDIVTTVDFGAAVDFHLGNKFDLTVGVADYAVKIPFGVVMTNAKGEVTELQEKPVHHYSVNAGLYVLNPGLIHHIPENVGYPITDLIELAIRNQSRVGAFPIHESWTDVGLPEQYFKVRDQAEA